MSKEEKGEKVRRPAWYKATEDEKNEYTSLLEEKLAHIIPPASLNCSDVTCEQGEHSADKDRHVLDVMCAIMEASHECIPLSSTARQAGKRENLPGWKENVAPAKKDALFWHSVWMSAGRPTSGGLYQVMRWTRNKFHYAVRRAKRLSGPDNVRVSSGHEVTGGCRRG